MELTFNFNRERHVKNGTIDEATETVEVLRNFWLTCIAHDRMRENSLYLKCIGLSEENEFLFRTLRFLGVRVVDFVQI